MLTHLRAGLRHLGLGNWDKATDLFVLAEASDSFSASAKTFLGMALAIGNKHEASKTAIKDAFDLNPFVPMALLDSNGELMHPVHTNVKNWTRELPNSQAVRSLPKPRWYRISHPRTYARVDAISTSGGDPIIQWGCGTGPHGRWDEPLLSRIGFESGDVKWTIPIKIGTLQFSSSRIVYVKDGDRWSLFSSHDGSLVGDFGQAYSEAAYFPAWARQRTEQVFKKLNASSIGHNRAWELLNSGGKTEVLATLPSGYSVDWPYLIETMNAELPVAGENYRLQCSNHWEEFTFGPRGSMTGFVSKSSSVTCRQEVTDIHDSADAAAGLD